MRHAVDGLLGSQDGQGAIQSAGIEFLVEIYHVMSWSEFKHGAGLQCFNPRTQARGFFQYEFGIFEGVRQQARALQRREEMQGVLGGLPSLAKQAKLLFEPIERRRKYTCCSVRQRPTFLVQLLAETADGATALREYLASVSHILNEGQ